MEKIIELKIREIQKKFNFEISDYILDVIPKGDIYEIIVFIGLAYLNNRLRTEQANVLIFEFCKKKGGNESFFELLPVNY